MVSVCLPSDVPLQHLPSYLGFSYLGYGVSLHSCSSKAQPLLLTLDKGYLLTAALPDLQRGMAPLGPPERSHCSLGVGLLLPFAALASVFMHLVFTKYLIPWWLRQRLKRLPGMWEMRVRSLGQEDPLEKEMATHSSILAWRIPWTEEPGGLTVHHKSQTWLVAKPPPHKIIILF